MLFIITTVLSWVAIIGFFLISILWDRQAYLQPKTINLVLITVLCSISVILSNVISYNLPFFHGRAIRLDFGIFVIFVTGMLFGPFYGILSGITSDTIGMFVNIGGSYSALFTLDRVLYGFMGALVFTKWWYNKMWSMMMVLFFVFIYGFISLVVDNLYLLTIGLSGKTILVLSIIKLIKWPIAVMVYLVCSFLTFSFLYYLMKKRFTACNLWCDRLPRPGSLFYLPKFHLENKTKAKKKKHDKIDDDKDDKEDDVEPKTDDEFYDETMERTGEWV